MYSNFYMTFNFFLQDYLLYTSRSIVVNYQRKLNGIHILYLWENIEILCSFIQEEKR